MLVIVSGLASFLFWLTGCAANQEQMENDMRGGKTFCEVHTDVPMCAKETE
jgi:hypothetical protein